jgi:hypothetical protein
MEKKEVLKQIIYEIKFVGYEEKTNGALKSKKQVEIFALEMISTNKDKKNIYNVRDKLKVFFMIISYENVIWPGLSIEKLHHWSGGFKYAVILFSIILLFYH